MFVIDEATMQEIKEGFHIPPKPEALQQLQQLKLSGDRDVIQASKIIDRDVELSGLILKTINSPLFGFGRSIVDIRQATVALGFDNVYNVTLSCLLKRSFDGHASISLERFWDQAFETASLCQKLATDFDSKPLAIEAYALGLFHDCGIAAMSLKYENYRTVLELANSSKTHSQEEIENQELGHTHTAVGYAIADSWNLPEHICHCIAIHNNQQEISKIKSSKALKLLAILDLADNLVCLRRNGHSDPNWGRCIERVYDILELNDDKVEALRQAIKQD